MLRTSNLQKLNISDLPSINTPYNLPYYLIRINNIIC